MSAGEVQGNMGRNGDNRGPAAGCREIWGILGSFGEKHGPAAGSKGKFGEIRGKKFTYGRAYVGEKGGLKAISLLGKLNWHQRGDWRGHEGVIVVW